MNSTALPNGLTVAAATAQLDSAVSTTLTAADGVAASRMQSLNQVHQARLSQLTRTATSLTAQYGSNAPQSLAAQAVVTSTQVAAARVAMLHLQATTAAPQVAATGWALHGRVYNAQQQPVAGYTVFLVDSQKNYLSAYGFSYTDSTGYFLLNSPVAATAAGMFVQIANTSAQPVYLAASAFEPNPGNAIYQNITLPAGKAVLGDPPKAIRKLAIPPK